MSVDADSDATNVGLITASARQTGGSRARGW